MMLDVLDSTAPAIATTINADSRTERRAKGQSLTQTSQFSQNSAHLRSNVVTFGARLNSGDLTLRATVTWRRRCAEPCVKARIPAGQTSCAIVGGSTWRRASRRWISLLARLYRAAAGAHRSLSMASIVRDLPLSVLRGADRLCAGRSPSSSPTPSWRQRKASSGWMLREDVRLGAGRAGGPGTVPRSGERERSGRRPATVTGEVAASRQAQIEHRRGGRAPRQGSAGLSGRLRHHGGRARQHAFRRPEAADGDRPRGRDRDRSTDPRARRCTCPSVDTYTEEEILARTRDGHASHAPRSSSRTGFRPSVAPPIRFSSDQPAGLSSNAAR